MLATGREAMVSRIRLAWWREALERLDHDGPPPEPVLKALADHVLPAGIAGAALAAMEEGWLELLSDGPLRDASLETYAAARGGALFRHSADLLGLPGHPVEAAGRRWALVDLARRSAEPAESAVAVETARRIEAEEAWPPKLRALGMLSVLTRRDIARGSATWERQGAPARMLRMLAHRLTGR